MPYTISLANLTPRRGLPWPNSQGYFNATLMMRGFETEVTLWQSPNGFYYLVSRNSVVILLAPGNLVGRVLRSPTRHRHIDRGRGSGKPSYALTTSTVVLSCVGR